MGRSVSYGSLEWANTRKRRRCRLIAFRNSSSFFLRWARANFICLSGYSYGAIYLIYTMGRLPNKGIWSSLSGFVIYDPILLARLAMTSCSANSINRRWRRSRPMELWHVPIMPRQRSSLPLRVVYKASSERNTLQCLLLKKQKSLRRISAI